jgi:hypothetical protein
MTRNRFVISMFIVTALVWGVTTVQAQEKFKETYEAFAVAMGTSNPPVLPAGVTATVQINITRWSTDEERNALLTTLIENGPAAMAKALNKEEETGWVRVMGTTRSMSPFPSERLRYARQFDLGEGRRRIVLALDRYISLWEQAAMPRWRDYDVTLIVMEVDAEGNGEGELAMGVRLNVDQEKKTLVIENFGTEPVRLTRIRRR